jgi:hypothetical protein
MTCFLVWILAGCEHLFFREELPRASFAYAFQPSIPFEPVSTAFKNSMSAKLDH